MAPKNQFGTRSSRANVRRIGQHRPRSVSPTSSTASTVVPDLAEEEVNEGVIFVAPGTRKMKRRQSLSPDITSFRCRPIKSNPGLLRIKPSTSHVRKVDTKSQQSKLSQPSGPTDGNKNGTRSSEANVRRIGQHRSRSASATSSTASPVAQDVEEREVNEGATLVAPGTRKIKRRQSLSPDITSFRCRPIKFNPALLRNNQSSSHLRKVDTKSQQSKLSQPSGPTDRNKNGTEANVRRIGQHRSRSVSPTSSTASTVVSDPEENEVNELVALDEPSPPLLCIKQCSVLLRRVDRPCEENSETVQAVEEIAFLRAGQVEVEVASVSPKENLHTDTKKTELYNDNESVRDVATDDPITPRNEEEETKKADAIARSSLNLGPFCSLAVELPSMEVTRQWVVGQNLKHGEASSSTQAAAEKVLPRSSSVSPTSSTASTVVSDLEENEVNELVTLVAPSPPLLCIKQCSVLLRRVDRPCEENSETVQEVEKIAFLRAGQVEVEIASVSSKENLHTDTKKTELYNDNESVRDVATDDPITPRNEEEETKKADAIAGSSVNLGPNIISSPFLPSSDSFCSLGVELSSMEATRQWVVRQNLKNRDATQASSTQAAAETALASSSSSVALITKAVENVTPSATKSSSKVVGTPRKRLPVPTVRIVDTKSVFMRDDKNINVDADPKLRTEVLKCDSDVPWICSFCHLGPHVQVRVLNNHGHVSPYAMGDLFGPYFANLPSIYGKSSPKRETWMHGDCGVWAGRLLLVKTSLKYLEETLSSADKEVCSICGKNGATIGCFRRKCKLAVHFPCAKSKGWKLDGATFLGYCPEHR